MKIIRTLSLLFLFTGIFLFRSPISRLIENDLVRKVLYGIEKADDTFLLENSLDLHASSQNSCRLSWLYGLVTLNLGQTTQSNQAWESAVTCQNDRVVLVMAHFPESEGLSELATIYHPENPYSWFWLAQNTKLEDPKEAITYYRKGLSIDSSNPGRWLELGDLLRKNYPTDAIEAYYQSCIRGDPGSNGCFRAGLTAEAQGDLRNAIYYFRLSHWSGALERADQLEESLNESP